jgi:hypothetical protein
MRIGISGTHGTGKTTLAESLCAHLPGHVTADEPYHLLEEEGYEFEFPPSLDDYLAMLTRSLQTLNSPSPLRAVVFDRTPLDYLAYLAATDADAEPETDAAAIQSAVATLDLLVLTVITPETERALPTPELPRLRSAMNDALLEIVASDPLDLCGEVPVLVLDGPIDDRLPAVLNVTRKI